ncbi:MAG TPA: AIM24 family protein, partial [Chitinophagaceae bacterium]|nr:AIM24 family protein [Chitinophagaceae bacterium]
MNESTRTNHEIDYKIYGEELQFVEIELDPNETAIAESGAMMMMDDGIQMQTIFGDGSRQQDNSVLG